MEEKQKKVKQNRYRQILFLAAFFVISAAFLIKTRPVEAATLFLSPSSGSYAIGQSFSTSVFVSSKDQAMNAASGVISFPKDKLEVTAVSKSGSIISLWVQEPSFSNSAGTISFEGIVLNPGYTGSSGKVITVTFKVRAAGSASLAFSSGSVLANDGLGTNILSGLGSAKFNLEASTTAPTAPKAETPAPVAGTPAAPKVFSQTHPDPDKWYAIASPRLNWDLFPSITAVRLLLGKLPQVEPNVTYVPPINNKELPSLEDGVWYFHIRLRNASGWGGVTHFRLQIDTQKPENFTIQEVLREDLTGPKVKFIFNAYDKTSGIDYYEIQIDGLNYSEQMVKREGASDTYETPVLEPGKHILMVRAVDKAGNFLTDSKEFTIQSLKPPIFTEYPKKLQDGEILMANGFTEYAHAQVVTYLKKDQDEPRTNIIKSDEKGNFTLVAEKVKDGIYQLWAEIVDERGAKSTSSEKVIIVVQRSKIFRIGAWITSILSVITPVVALIITLVLVLWYSWYKVFVLKRKLRKEVGEAGVALHKAFNLLRGDISRQLRMLEKVKTTRQLTEEERKIARQLRINLENAEKLVGKEIKDIEKEVK